MFYGVGKFKIFCDKECCKSWFQSNISKEDRNQGDKAVKEVFNDKTKQELKQGIAIDQGLIIALIGGANKSYIRKVLKNRKCQKS